MITRLGTASVNVDYGSVYTDAGATASDACDGNLTASIVKTGSVNTSVPATYTIRYNVSDTAGNDAAEVTRTVVVLAAIEGEGELVEGEGEPVEGEGETGVGSLQVYIGPANAVSAGAQWRRVGTGAWFNSDVEEIGINVGSYQVEFKDVVCWTKPNTQNIVIRADEKTTITGTYIASACEGEGEGETNEGEGETTEGEPTEGEPDCVGDPINVWMTNRNARHPVALPGGEFQVGEILIPINVSSTAAISPAGMHIEVSYDPEFLNPDTVQVRPTAITGKMSFLPNTEEAGRIIITTMGAMGGIGLKGQGHFFDIYAQIQPDVTPNTTSKITLDKVRFYNSSAQRQCVEVQPTATLRAGGDGLLGDLNGDGETDIGDALWALRIAVGLESSAANSVVTGDLNGDGRINSADAVLLQRLAADFDYVNPPPAQGEVSDPLLLANIFKDSVPVSVRVDDELATLDQEFDVAVRVDNAQGLSGYDVTLSFDDEVLEVVDVRKGTVASTYPQEWEVTGNLLRISMGRRDALYDATKASVDATLAVVRFRAKAMPAEGSKTEVRIEGLPALKGQYGDSYEWYTTVLKVYGEMTVQAASEGEDALRDIAQQLLDAFDAADTNDDGKLDYEEASGAVDTLTEGQLGELDANNDTFLTRDELEAYLEDGGCGCCKRTNDGKINLKQYFGDWLLVGLSLLVFVSLAGRQSGKT